MEIRSNFERTQHTVSSSKVVSPSYPRKSTACERRLQSCTGRLFKVPSAQVQRAPNGCFRAPPPSAVSPLRARTTIPVLTQAVIRWGAVSAATLLHRGSPVARPDPPKRLTKVKFQARPASRKGKHRREVSVISVLCRLDSTGSNQSVCSDSSRLSPKYPFLTEYG